MELTAKEAAEKKAAEDAATEKKRVETRRIAITDAVITAETNIPHEQFVAQVCREGTKKPQMCFSHLIDTIYSDGVTVWGSRHIYDMNTFYYRRDDAALAAEALTLVEKK